MTVWGSIPLGSTGEWLSGGTPSKQNPELWSGPVPWVSPKDMKRSRLTDALDHVSEHAVGSGTQLAPAGSLLMVVRGMILAHTFPVALAVRPLAFNQDVKALVPSERFEPEFLLQCLQAKASDVLRMVDVANHGTKRLASERLFALDIPAPPIGEQRKIAAILSSVDDAIEATQAVIDQLQVVKKAMMAELLTRGLPGRHTRFKKTEIGEVPEEWEVVQLCDVNERMFVGIAQAATHAYVAEGGVPIIRTTNVRPNRLVADDILRISIKFANEMRSKQLRAGDVLSARTGNPGVSIVVPPEYDGAQCFTLLVSRPGPRMLPKFLCHLMNSEHGSRIVNRGQAGGAQQNLNVGVFQEAIVPLPPVEEQRSIIDVIDSLYQREAAEQSALKGLRELKSALQSALLTGEIRVTPDEASP
ncbi:restriction endonuclease subunit S [Sorangium sp. So ce590]|uniref:restriction endonuclease subunit S n=1 Tax=Sorangium sp. So ce590 TaxID=3133317 RepID=UPI003F62C3BD